MPADAATLIDTGPIVAALDSRDSRHADCTGVFTEFPFAYTCWPVITEAVYLLGNYSPAVEKLYQAVRMRTWRLLSLDRADLDGIEAIQRKYSDQILQLADACLMYLAEREGIRQVLTLDWKDFGVFRTAAGESLAILPRS